MGVHGAQEALMHGARAAWVCMGHKQHESTCAAPEPFVLSVSHAAQNPLYEDAQQDCRDEPSRQRVVASFALACTPQELRENQRMSMRINLGLEFL